MLDEAEIISNLKINFPQYIGDDAAVIKKSGALNYVITNDLLVEDVHFRLAYFDPLSLAHKALHVNLSDLAAMGAKPDFVLLGISIPDSYGTYITSFFRHFSNVCKDASVILIGGDTTKSESKLFISITAIGIAAAENIKYRSTAKDGDIICVAGNLGYAHLGLVACEQSLNNFAEYKSSFLRPNAKVNEGIWLASKQSVTSMMDLSDGLYIDLKRLCQASSVGANLDLESLAPSSAFAANCNSTGLDPVNVMLTGGEDYCLLVTVQNNCYETLSQEFIQNFGYSIKPIGRIVEESEVHIIKNGKLVNLKLQPFTHFGEKA